MAARRRRSILVRLLQVLAVLLLLAAVALVVLFYTDWGQGKLRALVRDQLEKGLGTKVEIGKSHIGLGGHATAGEVTIADPAGGELIADVDAIDLDIDLIDLIRGRVHLEKVRVDGLTLKLVTGDDGVLNVTRLGGKTEGQTHLAVDQLVAAGCNIEYAVPGRRWHFDDVTVGGSLAVDAWGMAVRVDQLGGRWREVDRKLSVSGTYILSGGRSIVVGADAGIGASSIHSALFRMPTAAGQWPRSSTFIPATPSRWPAPSMCRRTRGATGPG